MDGKIMKLPAKESKSFSQDHIFIRSNSKFFRVRFEDIVYVQGMKDYLKIHTREHIIITHQTMSEMENILPADRFIRIHKSYIVAFSGIRAVFGNSVEMEKDLLPIGPNYKDKLMSLVQRS